MNFNEAIKKTISEKFPHLNVSVFSDETQDNMIVAIDDDLYYSEDYLSLVMDIKMNLLWKNNIFNYLFVKEEHRAIWETVPSPAVLSDAVIDSIYFLTEYKGQFTASHGINYSVEEDICLQVA
jgi:hypothetical protein